MGNHCFGGDISLQGGSVGRARKAIWDFQSSAGNDVRCAKLRLPTGLTEPEMEYIVSRLQSMPPSDRPSMVEVLVGPAILVPQNTQDVLASFQESLWHHQYRSDEDHYQSSSSSSTSSPSVKLVNQFFQLLLYNLESLEVTGYLTTNNFSGVIQSFGHHSNYSSLKSIRFCEMRLRGHQRGKDLHECLVHSWNNIHSIYMECCLIDKDMLDSFFLGKNGSLVERLPFLHSLTIVKCGLNDAMFELLLERLDSKQNTDDSGSLELDLHGNKLTPKSISILSNHLRKASNRHSSCRLLSLLLHSNPELDEMPSDHPNAIELLEVLQKHNTSLQDLTWHQCWMTTAKAGGDACCPLCCSLQQQVFFRNNRLAACQRMKQILLEPQQEEEGDKRTIAIDDDNGVTTKRSEYRATAYQPPHGLIPNMLEQLNEVPSAIYSFVQIRHVVEHISWTGLHITINL